MRPIKKGSTDQSVVIRIVDSSDGTPETGVEYNTSGIDLWYRREGATKTSITEAALAALDSPYSAGGIEHIGDGYYRLDLPDAAVATGANGVMVGGTVTGMIVIGCYVPLVDYDPYDSVRAGLTALPNAAADTAGGLPISDAGELNLDTLNANVSAILDDTGTNGVKLADDAITAGKYDESTAYPLTSADSGATQVARVGADGDTLETLSDQIDGVGGGGGDATAANQTTIINHLTDVKGTGFAKDTHSLTDIKGDTGDILDDTGTNGVKLADDAITSAKFDESTAFPIKSDDSGATQIARVGADGDTLETLSDQIDLQGTAANQTTIIGHLTDIEGTTFNSTTDSLEAIRDQGDTAWVTDIGGSCQHTYTVLDDDQNPIPEVRVEAWYNNVHVQTTYTDVNGQAVFYLDPGAYDFICKKLGYHFNNPDTEVVS